MKKRIILSLLLVVGVIFLSVILLNNLMKLPCDPPKRSENVPKTAIWSGGCDGGHWFEQVGRISVNNRYRIRIYNDYDGNLELDAEFGASDTCKKVVKDEIIVNKILVYNGEQIILKGNYCNLNEIKRVNRRNNF